MKLNTEIESNWILCTLAEQCAGVIHAMRTRLNLRGLYRAGLAEDARVYDQPPVNAEVRDVRRIVGGISNTLERESFIRLLKLYLDGKWAGQERTTRAYVASVRGLQAARKEAA